MSLPFVYDMYATNFVRNVRGTVAKGLENNPAFAGAEIGGQNVYSFLYQTCMSMGDFLYTSFLTGNFTGGLGGAGSEAAKKAAQNLSLAIMGSSAAANTTVEAIERGLSNRQAYTLGAVAGIAEIVTERFSLEALLDGSWEKNAVQYVLKNTFTEGSEEVGSDLINLLADVLVAKDQSEWRQSIKKYEDQGLKKEEAFAEAVKDQAMSMGMSFLGGSLSGGFMAGSNVTINKVVNSYYAEGWVTNSMAEQILADPEAVRELGISLTEDMTPEQKNTAVKDALKRAISGETDAGKKESGPDSGLDSGGMTGSDVTINKSDIQTDQTETLVSDATAEDLLRNESTVKFLSKNGGLKLEKGMPQEQKRAAIRQAVENVVHKKKTASGEGDGETHYSLKAFEDGRRFVNVDTDQEQFDGLTFKELGYRARRVIKEKFKGKVIGIDNQAFVNGNTAEEYGRPVKKLSPQEHEAKMRASAELDNLLDAGINFRTEPDGRDGHTHPKATGDFRYFDTIFKVGDEYYTGVINIEHIEKGLLLKDITNIRNITQEIHASYGENPQGSILRDVSVNSIPQKAQKGNKKVSTEGVDVQGQEQPAQPLTQADAKHFATETGTENGLVLDDYVQKHLRPETAKRLNTLAQALGVRVRFVSSIRDGTANASIRGNEVQIERYNPNPVTFLLGHELTHRMQQLSPEAYTRFKEAVRADVEKEAQGLHSLYRIRGENIDFEGAMDEATANYAGRLLEEGPVLDEFIQRHRTDRSLLEKVLDAIRDMLSRLTGTERKQAETAEGKLLAALEETAEKVKKDGEETTAGKEIADRKAQEEGELGEIFRRTVKGFAEGGKVVDFRNLPQKYRSEFLTGLESAESHVKSMLLETYDTVDYVLGMQDRSYHRRGVRGQKGTVYLGKNATPSTMAHELFHQIDEGHQISKTLSAGLTQDYVALNVVSGGDIKGYLMERYPEAFRMSRRGIPVMQSQYRGIADILNGLSGGQTYYGYGHKVEYWERQGSLEAEAWAQLGRVLFENDPQVLKMFSDIFPNLLKDGTIALEGSD